MKYNWTVMSHQYSFLILVRCQLRCDDVTYAEIGQKILKHKHSLIGICILCCRGAGNLVSAFKLENTVRCMQCLIFNFIAVASLCIYIKPAFRSSQMKHVCLLWLFSPPTARWHTKCKAVIAKCGGAESITVCYIKWGLSFHWQVLAVMEKLCLCACVYMHACLFLAAWSAILQKPK